MYNRSTSPSTIWPGRTDSAWLARARIFSDIVWPVIEIGGCTGAGRAINMAMDGPKALRDGRHPGPMPTSSTRSAAFAMLCLIWGSTWLAIRIGLEGAPPFLSASLRFAVASIVLVLLGIVFRSKWPQNRTEWALVGFVGIVLFTADYGLIYWGENNGVLSGLSAIAGSVVTFVAWQWLLKAMPATSPSYIALIIPIVAVLLGAGLGNETFDLVDLAGAGIVLLGIYVSTSRRAAAFARAAMGLAVADPDPDPADPPARKT